MFIIAIIRQLSQVLWFDMRGLGVSQLCAIIGFCIFPHGIFCFEKQWLFYNTWNDKLSWDPPRLPCEKDRITIVDGTVFIGANSTTSSEINLPKNGEMVFANDAELVIGASISSGNDELCQSTGQDIKFVGQPTKKWLQPMNWEVITNGRVDEYLTKAAPFIERVPCLSDSVKFKVDAFKVDISDPVTVNQLVLGQQVIKDNNLLQSYLKSSDGKSRLMLSSSSSSLTLDSSQSCAKEGCLCGNEKIRDKICSNFKCPSVCKRKVLPSGDCCYHCGALLEFKFSIGFDLNSCWRAVREQSSKNQNGSMVYVYMSRITEEKIQILLTDENDGKSAETILYIVKSYLESDISYCNAYDIVSTFWHNTTILPDQQTGDSSRAKVTGIVIGCIAVVIVLIIVIVAWIKRRRDESSVKFDNNTVSLPGIEDVEYATTDFMEHYNIRGVSFDNPTYNAMFEDSETRGRDAVDEKSPKFDIPINFIPDSQKLKVEQNQSMDNSFENPVYDMIDDEVSKDVSVSSPDDSVQNNPLYPVYNQDEVNVHSIDQSRSEKDLYADDETDSVASLKATLKLELKMEEEQEASMDNVDQSVALESPGDTKQNGTESVA